MILHNIEMYGFNGCPQCENLLSTFKNLKTSSDVINKLTNTSHNKDYVSITYYDIRSTLKTEAIEKDLIERLKRQNEPYDSMYPFIFINNEYIGKRAQVLTYLLKLEIKKVELYNI